MNNDIVEGLVPVDEMNPLKSHLKVLREFRDLSPKQQEIIIEYLCDPTQKKQTLANKCGVSPGYITQIFQIPVLGELMIKVARIQKARLVPQAMKVLEDLLEAKSENVRLATAVKILEDTQVVARGNEKTSPTRIEVNWKGVMLDGNKSSLPTPLETERSPSSLSQEPNSSSGEGIGQNGSGNQ